MRLVQPKAYLVGETRERHEPDGMMDYLRDIGAIDHPSKTGWSTDGSDGDLIAEVAGRICYRSFFPYDPERPDCTNPNVENVRSGNAAYLANILKQRHGSILEHSQYNVIFHNVSRIFTHELVRHRAGCSYSQESFRYVRLDEIKVWFPPTLAEMGKDAVLFFLDSILSAERRIREFGEKLGISSLKDFHSKKERTSLMRRLMPDSMATTIMVSANARAWRHILTMRGNPGAEEEIRHVMPQALRLLSTAAPAQFQDMSIDLLGFVVCGHEKV